MDRQLTMNRRGFLCGTAALGALAAFGGTMQSQAQAAPADRIVIGRPQDSNNLDPVTCVGNTNIFIFNLVIEGLVMTSDDGSDIELCLADSYEVSEDGLVWTFAVKPGLVFSDGTPVTAEDWQFTFDRAIESEDSAWHMCVENIDHVDCPDDTTVIITMKQPAASTLANLCIFTLGVQSKAYFEKVGAEAYCDCIIGTGPYTIKEWRKGEYLTLAANPNYRVAGLPLTKEIEFKVVAEDASRTIQLQGGDIDIATELPLSTMKFLENYPDIEVIASPSTLTRFMALNVEYEPLKNKAARRALIKATNPQQIVDAALYGYGIAIGTIFAPTSKYCDHSLDPTEPDIAEAKALLAKAGLPNGFEISIMIHSGNELEKQVAMILMAQWAQIGVTVKIDEAENTTYRDRMYSMQFETLIDMWSDDIQDPSEFMQWVFDFDSAAGFDTNFRQPAETEALNAAINVESDDQKRVEMYAELQQAFADQAIWIPLFAMPWASAARKDVTGFVQTPLGNYRFNNLAKGA